MAIIDAGYLDADDDVYNDDGGSELHHRSRRSVSLKLQLDFYSIKINGQFE